VAIDPGLGATEVVGQFCQQNQLTLTAVLASHGHIDHVADAALLADRWQAPLWIHPADRELLSNPMLGLDPPAQALFVEFTGGTTLAEPRQVAELDDGQVLELAGLSFSVIHVPGHRPGCVVFRVAFEGVTLAFTGDFLFAGSIGRTDLPGGSMKQMVASLRRILGWTGEPGEPLDLPDDTIVLPGHGPRTTMAVERSSNPFLQTDFLEAQV